MIRTKQTFTRPGNATTYAAGDAVCNSDGDYITFFDGEQIESGSVIAGKLSISNGSTTNASFELFLFRDYNNIPSLTDNSAFAMTAAAEEDLIGYMAFTLITTGSSGSAVAWDSNVDTIIPFKRKVGSDGTRYGLYGVLTATAAYDPVSELTDVDVTLYVDDGHTS